MSNGPRVGLALLLGLPSWLCSQSWRNNRSHGDYRGCPSEPLPALWRVGLPWRLEGCVSKRWNVRDDIKNVIE
jgi:hypothetical protein